MYKTIILQKYKLDKMCRNILVLCALIDLVGARFYEMVAEGLVELLADIDWVWLVNFNDRLLQYELNILEPKTP